jgi:hypothetical protein
MASDAFVDQPFKNREHVIAEIRLCARAGGVLQLLSFPFVALGTISDALNITLGLEPISWFLLTMIALCASIVPQMHIVVAKHLLGIESESKKE